MPARIPVASLLAVALSFPPTFASALQLVDGKLSVDGNGQWAFRKTDHNAYLAADPDGTWTTAMFDLLVAAHVTPEVTLTAQAGFEPSSEGGEGGAELEWAFAEWRLSDQFRLRAGKVKHPFGNYAELAFVGTVRPFFDLATSVYGPSDMAASSYSGVGVTGEWQHESGYGIAYDVYGGAMEVAVYGPWDLPDPIPAGWEGPQTEEELVENVGGARVSLLTPWEVTVRLSGFTGEERGGSSVRFSAFGPSVFYRGDRLWLSVEAFRSLEEDAHGLFSAYGEAAWFLGKHLQVAARYEWARVDRSLDAEFAPSRLLRHDEVAVGANWWITRQSVAKLSLHQIWGERFATPDVGTAPRSDATFLVVAGTQFTF